VGGNVQMMQSQSGAIGVAAVVSWGAVVALCLMISLITQGWSGFQALPIAVMLTLPLLPTVPLVYVPLLMLIRRDVSPRRRRLLLVCMGGLLLLPFAWYPVIALGGEMKDIFSLGGLAGVGFYVTFGLLFGALFPDGEPDTVPSLIER
jgi:hypothetical protein